VALWTALCGVHVCAGLEPAGGDYLVPGPNSDGEGAGAEEQDGIGAVVEPLQGWDDATRQGALVGGHRGGPQQAPLAAGLLARQKKNGGI
jgi:hypothetical protein